MTEFKPFPKMARWSREIIVTEKIDGTNASIYIGEDGEFKTGSRTRWITPENDNYGFSKWAHDNKDELMQLGPGLHFGEWWGCGIQRNYGLSERRFSLFNATRWEGLANIPDEEKKCFGVVPVLYKGNLDNFDADWHCRWLSEYGSRAAPGFMDPEGIIIRKADSQLQGMAQTITNNLNHE